MLRDKKIHSFEGKLDTDTTGVLVKDGDIVSALNTFSGKGGELGARQPLPGDVNIPFTFADPTNFIIGAVEDPLNNRVFYFAKSNQGTDPQHTLMVYEKKDHIVRKLDQGPHLEFDTYIHSAQVIDGRFLAWTDGYVHIDPVPENGLTIEGSEPKMYDIDKLDLIKKRLQYEVHFDEDSFQVLNSTYTLRVEELDGTIITADTLFFTNSVVQDAALTWQLFQTALAGVTGISTVDYNNKIVITPDDDEWRVILTQSTSDLHLVNTNHYPTSIIKDYITLIRPVPKTGPTPNQINDTSIIENKIWGNSFRFRYRYIFRDNTRSAFSPISYVPTNFVTYDDTASTLTKFARNDESFNMIKVHLNENLLLDEDWKSLIGKVEVAVEVNGDNIWRSVGVYDVADIGVSVHYVLFTNAENYSLVQSDEDTEGSAQAFKNFDFVPRIAESMALVSGDRGQGLLALGGLIEGFDLEPSINGVASANYYDGSAPTSVVDQTVKNRSLKKGGVYDVAVLYEDDYGRQSTPQKFAQVKIPWVDNQDDDVGLNISFDSTPPVWAKRYRIAISNNQNQSQYLQLPCSYGEYYKISESGSYLAERTLVGGDPDVTHIAFVFSRTAYGSNEASEVVTMFKNVEVTKNFFAAEVGDRIQFCAYNNVGALSGEDLKEYNFPVAGYSFVNPDDSTPDRENYYVFVEITAELRLLLMNGGADVWILCELYQQKSTSDEFYYELPFVYDVEDPGTAIRSHGAARQLQFFGDTFTGDFKFSSAIDHADVADALHIEIISYCPHVERSNLHYERIPAVSDLGRALAEDPDYRQIHEYNKVRASDVLIPETGINGLSSWRGLNYIKVDRSLGFLKKLSVINRVMLSVCNFGCQPIYLGFNDVVDLSGNQVMGISDRVFNLGDPLAVRYGTHFPESVINTGRAIYFFDSFNGVFARYTPANGLFPVSDYGMNAFFKEYADQGYILDRNNGSFVCGYDPKRELVFLTFLGDKGQETLIYNESKQGFDGHAFFAREYYCTAGMLTVSFFFGQIYIHEHADHDYCNYRGIQSTADVEFAFNENPTAKKIPHSIRVRSNEQWHVENIDIPADSSFKEGMKSRIKAGRFDLYEGDWCADFLRDMNDTRSEFLAIVDDATREATALLKGRHLKGNVIYVKLRLTDSTKNGILEAAEISYSLSQNSF